MDVLTTYRPSLEGRVVDLPRFHVLPVYAIIHEVLKWYFFIRQPLGCQIQAQMDVSIQW